MQGAKPEEDDSLLATMKEVGLAHKQFFERRGSRSGLRPPLSESKRANTSGRLRSQTQLRMRRRLRLGRKPRKMLPLLPVLCHPGSPRNRRKKLWRVYLRTYGKPGARRDCAIVVVSRSTVGNGAGEKSSYHLPARQRRKGRVERRRTRTTLRRHQRRQPARLHSREKPQPIR